MGLRKHQSEMNQTIDGIISGHSRFKDIKEIILSVVAGGGKGSVPVNAGKLILAGMADSICCVVPRQSLQQQCEEVFMDKFFKKMFGVNLSLRASTNDFDPCRGQNGFVTTYQALGHDKKGVVLDTIRRRRFIVILDEFHHVEEDSPWHEAVEEIINAATFVIKMSGTLSRANKKKIACMKYKNGYVDLAGDKHTHVIRYSRTDALQEQAILPIDFHLHDGEFQWREHTGQERQVDSFAQVKPKDRSSALYTALQTEFSEQLIDATLAHWLKYRENKPQAKALFVTARIEDARRCMDYLESLEIPSLLATSHTPKECIKNINLFKTRALALVTIAVAYEGLDVPAVSHICVLTRIRSKEWMEQCVSRATRVHKSSGSYRSQAAHVFAPKDPAFLEFVTAIEKEQVTRAQAPKEEEEQLELFPLPEELVDSEGGGPNGPCIPLKSQILELSRRVIGRGAGGFSPRVPVTTTPKQEELSLRKRIQKHLTMYATAQGYEIPQVMRDVKEIFNGKPRDQLNIEELRILWASINQRYPLRDNGQFIYDSRTPPVFHQPEVEQELNFF